MGADTSFSCLCRIENNRPTMAKNKNVGKPRNYALESGVYRFGKSKTYHKKAVYKFLKKKTAKKAVKPTPVFVEKQTYGSCQAPEKRRAYLGQGSQGYFHQIFLQAKE